MYLTIIKLWYSAAYDRHFLTRANSVQLTLELFFFGETYFYSEYNCNKMNLKTNILAWCALSFLTFASGKFFGLRIRLNRSVLIVESIETGETTGRIVGGIPISIQAVPYQVSLQVLELGRRTKHICGGSIISEIFVATAGHCVEWVSFAKYRFTYKFY